MYAVAASYLLGSMPEMVLHFGNPGMFAVRLVHVVPPSRVMCINPSIVPAQIRSFCSGDSAIANSTVTFSTNKLSVTNPPDDCCFVVSFVDRSGEISVQLCPPLTVLCTYCEPTYTVL